MPYTISLEELRQFAVETFGPDIPDYIKEDLKMSEDNLAKSKPRRSKTRKNTKKKQRR